MKYYLLAYNILSALGWAYVLLLTLTHILDLDGRSSAVPPATAATASSTISKFFTSIPFLKSTPKLTPTALEYRLPAFLQPVYRRSTTTFGRVGTTTAVVQSFAVLEVVHVLLGWVRSPLQTTVMQVSSRLFLVWGIAEQFASVRFSTSTTTKTIRLMNSLSYFTGSNKPAVYLHGSRLVPH